MKLCSLFAGIGGFDLGFQRAGFETVLQCEINKNCQAVLVKHFPTSTQTDCVSELAKLLRKKKPNEREKRITNIIRSCRIITGGFPCQDLSVAGQRVGLAGARSGLWFEFHSIIASVRPAWVVIENVPGLRSSNKGKDLFVILQGLEKLGYWWAYRTIDAQYYNVAQRRERVFIVASFGNRSCAEILFERESVCGNPKPSRQTRKEVAGTLGSRTSAGGGLGTDLECDGGLVATISSKWAKGTGGRSGDEVQNLVAHSLTSNGFDASEDGTGRGTPLIAFNGRMDPVNGDIPGTLDGDDRTQCIAFNLRGRNGGSMPETNDKASIRASNGGSSRSYVNKTGVRRLTPTECLRLQGFPDDWLDIPKLKDGPKYRMTGNAVCVNVAERIAKRISANG